MVAPSLGASPRSRHHRRRCAHSRTHCLNSPKRSPALCSPCSYRLAVLRSSVAADRRVSAVSLAASIAARWSGSSSRGTIWHRNPYAMWPIRTCSPACLACSTDAATWSTVDAWVFSASTSTLKPELPPGGTTAPIAGVVAILGVLGRWLGESPFETGDHGSSGLGVRAHRVRRDFRDPAGQLGLRPPHHRQDLGGGLVRCP